jgi:hypothetical protein
MAYTNPYDFQDEIGGIYYDYYVRGIGTGVSELVELLIEARDSEIRKGEREDVSREFIKSLED